MLPSTPRDIGLRPTWKRSELPGPSSVFETTFEAQSFAKPHLNPNRSANPLEILAKLRTTTREFSDGAEISQGSTGTLKLFTGSAIGNAGLISCLPQPATEHNRSGSSRPTPVDDEVIHLVWACGLCNLFSPVLGIGLGGMVPWPDGAALGGPS